MAKKRRQYTREFKVEAVKPVTEGGTTMDQAARGLDFSRKPDCCKGLAPPKKNGSDYSAFLERWVPAWIPPRSRFWPDDGWNQSGGPFHR